MRKERDLLNKLLIYLIIGIYSVYVFSFITVIYMPNMHYYLYVIQNAIGNICVSLLFLWICYMFNYCLITKLFIYLFMLLPIVNLVYWLNSTDFNEVIFNKIYLGLIISFSLLLIVLGIIRIKKKWKNGS